MPLRGFTLEREALEVFGSATRHEREDLLSFFEFLQTHPDRGFDSILTDDLGRPLKAVHHGHFAVFWWEDFADRRLRVVAIERLK